MDELTNTAALSDDARANRLSGLMNKNHRMIASAFGAAVFVAVVNTLIGATTALAPGILDSLEFGGFGWFYCLVGFIMFVVAAGIHYKSRVCVVIGLVFMIVDTALSDLPGLLKSGNIAYFIMRGVILYALIMGLIGAFQHHSYKRRFSSDPNPTVAALFTRGRFHASAGMILYALLAAACLAIGVFSFLQENQASFDISSWDTYTTADGLVTIPMPSAPEVSTANGIQSMRSLSRKAFVSLHRVASSSLFSGLSADEKEAVLTQMLESGLTGQQLSYDMDAAGPDGTQAYIIADAYHDGALARYEAFFVDDTLYIAMLAADADRDDNQALALLDHFSDAITINR